MGPKWKDGDKWLHATAVAYLLCINRNALKALMAQPFDPLPPPFPFGNSRRWLASEVWGWMERRMERQSSGSDGTGQHVAAPVTEVQLGTPEVAIQRMPKSAWLVELKQSYEAGATLDELCRRERLGKARLSALLREAGTAIRSPGRRELRIPAGSGRH